MNILSARPGFILCFVAVLLSCGQQLSERKEPGTSNGTQKDHTGPFSLSDTILEYKSEGNDQPEIRLTFRKNNSFSYYMRILPEFGTNEKEDTLRYYGTWIKQKN